MDEFETDREGNIITCPLAGWTTAPFAGMALLARLDWYPDPASLQSGTTQSVQLALTPQQCREFGQLLLRMADQLSLPPQNGASQ